MRIYLFWRFHRYFLNEWVKRRLFECYGNTNKTFWFPHSFEPMIYKDYKFKKEYGFLQTGASDGVYVFRERASKALRGCNFYKRIKSPTKDSKLDKYDRSCVLAKGPFDFEYAMELNKSYMSLATGSTMNYPVAKYNEIAACNSVVYSNWYPELSDLGYKKDENIIIMEEDILGQVTDLMKDKDRLLEIAENGYLLAHERHTNKIRANEFVDIVKKLI